MNVFAIIDEMETEIGALVQPPDPPAVGVDDEPTEPEIALPSFCSAFCQCRFDDGCMCDPHHWVPLDRMNHCPKVGAWGCVECEHFYQEWCSFDLTSYVSIEFLGVCPKSVRDPVPEGEPWSWNEFAKREGCYGCGFASLNYGEILCRYDNVLRTAENQKPCPVNGHTEEPTAESPRIPPLKVVPKTIKRKLTAVENADDDQGSLWDL